MIHAITALENELLRVQSMIFWASDDDPNLKYYLELEAQMIAELNELKTLPQMHTPPVFKGND